ncbi:hypothetical protein LWI28_013383 [Acer negundo]|uniref:Uncharacterized protein n=1 Tax=Acer negundo TaxID=4023 RepID=A0AAD5JAJ0_ACENE|nr:hypothetical protein LWI28_013383 [Acer negundo]
MFNPTFTKNIDNSFDSPSTGPSYSFTFPVNDGGMGFMSQDFHLANPGFNPSSLAFDLHDIDEVSQAINNIMVKIRGRILLKSGGMMRIKKHYQMMHCLVQLGQLQGPRGSKKYLMRADSELLKSKFGPHED